VEIDDRREKINYKIREAQTEKIPFALVAGDKEMEEGTIAVRRYGQQNTRTFKVEEFLELIKKEIATKRNVQEA